MRRNLVNATNLSAATRYYPDAAGLKCGPLFSRLSVEMVISGNVTCTVEITHDEPDEDGGAAATWHDVTRSFTDAVTGIAGAASYVDQSTTVYMASGLTAHRLRIKSVTADATNAVHYVLYGD